MGGSRWPSSVWITSAQNHSPTGGIATMHGPILRSQATAQPERLKKHDMSPEFLATVTRLLYPKKSRQNTQRALAKTIEFAEFVRLLNEQKRIRK
jgi:hypothetical protein